MGGIGGRSHQFILDRRIADPEAQDLTQEFMLHLLRESMFERADPLRAGFVRSCSAPWSTSWPMPDKHAALKREGGRLHFGPSTI